MITFKQFFTETGELGCLIRGLKVLNFLVGESNSGIYLYWNWIKWTRKKKKRKCIFNFCKSTKVLVGNLVPSSDGIFTLLIKVFNSSILLCWLWGSICSLWSMSRHGVLQVSWNPCLWVSLHRYSMHLSYQNVQQNNGIMKMREWFQIN